MKKILLFSLFSLFFFAQANAQRIGTRKGEVAFHSDAKLEQIDAVNQSASVVFDYISHKIQFAVLIKGFLFKKALMQEHFNENYMESSKYPKATFKGKFDNILEIKDAGTHETTVTGKLTIHGVTKEVTVPVVVEVSKESFVAKAKFDVVLADYNIQIPAMVKGKVAKTVSISVKADLKSL